MSELLMAFGSEIKAAGDGKVEGYLCRYSTPRDPDLEGDFFTSETDFGIHTRLPLYYQHGFDGRIKGRRIGSGDCRKDDVGIWFAAQMDLRDEYERMIYSMVEAGKLGYSSGAISHLVEREPMGKSFWLKTWPLGESSLTPTPAEPRNGVQMCKTFFTEASGQEFTLDEISTERDYELFLRARGCNKQESTALVAIAKRGFKSLPSWETEEKVRQTRCEEGLALLDRSMIEIGV